MTEQERQRVIEHARKSLQRALDREIFILIAIANDIDVNEVLREFDSQENAAIHPLR